MIFDDPEINQIIAAEIHRRKLLDQIENTLAVIGYVAADDHPRYDSSPRPRYHWPRLDRPSVSACGAARALSDGNQYGWLTRGPEGVPTGQRCQRGQCRRLWDAFDSRDD